MLSLHLNLYTGSNAESFICSMQNRNGTTLSKSFCIFLPFLFKFLDKFILFSLYTVMSERIRGEKIRKTVVAIGEGGASITKKIVF